MLDCGQVKDNLRLAPYVPTILCCVRYVGCNDKAVVAEIAVRMRLSKDCMHQRSGGKGISVMAGRD